MRLRAQWSIFNLLPYVFFERVVRLRGGCDLRGLDTSPCVVSCKTCGQLLTDEEANAVLRSFVGEKPRSWVLDIQNILNDNDYEGDMREKASNLPR